MCYGVWETQTEVTNLLGEWVLMTFLCLMFLIVTYNPITMFNQLSSLKN